MMQTPSHTAFVLQAVCFDVDSTLWVTASMPPCMLFIEHLFLSWQLASLRLTCLPSGVRMSPLMSSQSTWARGQRWQR